MIRCKDCEHWDYKNAVGFVTFNDMVAHCAFWRDITDDCDSGPMTPRDGFCYGAIPRMEDNDG